MASDMAKLRYMQIESLRTYFSTLKTLSNDVYEVPITLPNKQRITLRITLPSDFPVSRPALRVFPQVSHRLVDLSMNVKPEASSKLSNWVPNNSLGKLVWSVTKKFMEEPPLFLTGAAAAAAGGASSSSSSAAAAASLNASGPPKPSYLQSSGGGGGGGGASSASRKRSGSSAGGGGGGALVAGTSISMPPIPSSFPELERLKPAELGELLNDEAAFARFVANMDGVRTMQKLRDDLKGADDNQDKSAEELDAKIKTARAAHDAAKAEFDALHEQQQAVTAKLSIDNLVSQLAELATEAERESDDIARDFLDGSIDEKQFRRKFLDVRTRHHLRAAKRESLGLRASRRAARS